MPTKTFQKMICNLCNAEAERELLPDLPPCDWAIFKQRNAQDEREKIHVAICPKCIKAILAALPKPSVAIGANQEPAPGATPATNAASKKHGAEAEKPNPPPGPDPAAD